MPSHSERHRNNVKAGIFVSLSLALGLVVIMVLTDAFEGFRRQTTSYTVVFDVASGVPNIKRGSEVRVGGLRMGQVTRIEPRLATGTKTLSEIAVEFELDDVAQLYADAQILVAAPLIGSEGWLDIPHVGSPATGEASGEIQGANSAGFLTSLLGGENRTKADEIVENARLFSEFLSSLPSQYDQLVVPILDDVKSATQDVRSVADSLEQQHWPAWAATIDDVMTWAGALSPKIDHAIAEGTGLLTDARGVVAENRKPLHAAIVNVQAVSERITHETVDKVHALLASGQEGLDAAVTVLRDLEVDYDQWAVEIGETLGSAAIASQQLKLATIEVRRSPWKLLYRPTTEELEHELLYEAARSFAVAAADVKAAAASVERVVGSNRPEVLQDADAFRRLQQNLVDSLGRYERTQQQLLDVIIADHSP